MAIYHLSARTIGRGKGRSALAAAAYRTGTKLYDEETGLTYDYTRKVNVLYRETMLCENAPAEYADREVLWNAVHKAEKRSDARFARDFDIALPNELPFEEAKMLARDFCKTLTDDGMCVDFGIHWDEGNHHIHVLATTRPIKENGEWGAKEKSTFALDENGNKIPLLDENGQQKVRVRKGKGEEKLWVRTTVDATGWNSKDKLYEWRYNWQELCNAYLVEYDKEIDCRSFAERGIDRIPTKHEGYAARQMEEDGTVSELCEYNRTARAANARLDAIEQEQKQTLLAKLAAVIEQIYDKLKAREKTGQDAPEMPAEAFLDAKGVNTPPAPENATEGISRPVFSQQEAEAATILTPEPTKIAPEQPKALSFAEVVDELKASQREYWEQTYLLNDNRPILDQSELTRLETIVSATSALETAVQDAERAKEAYSSAGFFQRGRAESACRRAEEGMKSAAARLERLGAKIYCPGSGLNKQFYKAENWAIVAKTARRDAEDQIYKLKCNSKPLNHRNGDRQRLHDARERFAELAGRVKEADRVSVKHKLKEAEKVYSNSYQFADGCYAARHAQNQAQQLREKFLSTADPRPRERVQEKSWTPSR